MSTSHFTLKLTAAAILIAGTAHSADLTLYANNPNAGITAPGGFAGNIVGNQTSFAPGFPFGSWQGTPPGPNGKQELYLLSTQLFPGKTVKIADIASVTYWTNKPTDATNPDWTFLIYTARLNNGTDTGSFYHTRLNSEPYLTNTPIANDPANTWHQWSTNDPNNPMRFYDALRDGGIFGTFTDPTLAALQAGPITWPTSGTTYNYSTANDVVLFFSLQTGSAWAGTFTGMVDGLTITLNDGTVANVNLEAAPLDGVFQVRYASNLNAGDGVFNVINPGTNGAPLAGPGFGGNVGNICVNAYAFSPDEQLIACCSCLVTPNGVAAMSVRNDLISNTLTGVRPDSVVIKLVNTATGPGFTGNACSNSAALAGSAGFPLAAGFNAFGTTVHAGPVAGSFATTETPFSNATLSPGELASITGRCTNIIGNGSTFGICNGCRNGGLMANAR